MDLSILKYITFEPKKLKNVDNSNINSYSTPLSSNLNLIKNSFIDKKSYVGCSDERECLYFYVKFITKILIFRLLD